MKKLVCLLLAAMMVIAVALPLSAMAEGATISFFDKNSGSRTFDDPIAMELQKRTGVTLKLINPTGDPAEKLSLMLGALDYPDIVLMDRSSDIVNQYIEAGALVPLSDYLDLMPNVVAMYGDVLNKTRYTDGKNYYLSNWYGYDPDPVNGFIMRYDYMVDMVGKERADSPEPFAYDEFVALLKAWKEKYPTIDGAETMPLVLSAPSSGSINGTFAGMNQMYPYYVDENKNIAFVTKDPKFLTAMHQMNELYREGLIDPEWTSNTQELRNQKLSNTNVFGYVGAYWDTWTPSASLLSTQNPDAEYLAYKVLPEGVDADKTTLAGRSSLGWDAIALTVNCKDIEAACKFIDYCASQEGQDLLLWGIEGDTWEFKDGVRTPIGDIVERYKADPSNTVNNTGITKWTWYVKNDVHPDDGTTCRIWFNEKDRCATYAYQNLCNSYYDSAEFAVLEPAGGTMEALQYQKLVDLFDQAYPQMVNAKTVEECDAVYAKLIKDMEASGEAAVEAYMTGIYQARMKLWGMME